MARDHWWPIQFTAKGVAFVRVGDRGALVIKNNADGTSYRVTLFVPSNAVLTQEHPPDTNYYFDNIVDVRAALLEWLVPTPGGNDGKT